METAAHILVIDDDARLRDLLRRFLEESGFMVTDAENAAHARAYMDSMMFDLMIIDVMMPGETGVEFLTEVRRNSDIPALFLTALSEAEDRIAGLEIGADDYISKPFEPRELILRIKRILNRRLPPQPHDTIVEFGPFRFDTETRLLFAEGRRVHLTSAEQDLLGCFARDPNRILSRDDITEALGGRMKGRSIDVAVARLRTKLEGDPRFAVLLQTIRGKGWMLKTD